MGCTSVPGGVQTAAAAAPTFPPLLAAPAKLLGRRAASRAVSPRPSLLHHLRPRPRRRQW
jgi:hypothetical protein